MMKRYAIIENGTVVNVVLWDGQTECEAIPDGAVELTSDSPVAPGYTREDGSFIAPPPAMWPPVEGE
ncbi:hypothetical protein [Pandoraea commovens]|uniref:Phage tail protein n=1 Tax=Pandoraea commovens TaxID=2508289 RepID=A0ABY5QI63_9BURK|nr:hypothetical protein [Pandoraea commovens]UVA80472.1 hypothetical protein NTU39_05465 [Pandoraea commovens]